MFRPEPVHVAHEVVNDPAFIERAHGQQRTELGGQQPYRGSAGKYRFAGYLHRTRAADAVAAGTAVCERRVDFGFNTLEEIEQLIISIVIE